MLGKETTETKTVFPDSFMQNYKKKFREKSIFWVFLFCFQLSKKAKRTS